MRRGSAISHQIHWLFSQTWWNSWKTSKKIAKTLDSAGEKKYSTAGCPRSLV